MLERTIDREEELLVLPLSLPFIEPVRALDDDDLEDDDWDDDEDEDWDDEEDEDDDWDDDEDDDWDEDDDDDLPIRGSRRDRWN